MPGVASTVRVRDECLHASQGHCGEVMQPFDQSVTEVVQCDMASRTSTTTS